MNRLATSIGTANRRLSHKDYTIAWISTLPLEMAVAEAMLDERHPRLSTPPSDDNAYIFGRIHDHNVVIACLPAGVYGTNSAAIIASQIRSTFWSIRFGLMVGIGGGVPTVDADIRLGDVVVSKPTRDFGGIVQYDYGKALSGGRFERTGILNKPPTVLLTAVSRLQAAHMIGQNQVPALLSEMITKYPAMKDNFAYPKAHDQLFNSEYDHNDSENTCINCDRGSEVKRDARLGHDPAIHYGLIASANQVMKDGRTRDKLAQELGILCFEMEAAGLMDNFPCLVIRGICDYADSHKNKKWQGYAAAAAAAYAKELLSVVQSNQVVDTPTQSAASVFHYQEKTTTETKLSSGAVQRSYYYDEERILKRVSSYDYEKTHSRLSRKRLADSTEWFLDHPDFKAWLTEGKTSSLWCSGKIGSGKTMIATAATDAAKYRYSESPPATVFFYCQNERGETLQTSYILSSFIKQLCDFLRRYSKPFPDGLAEKLRSFFGNDRIVPDFEDLQDIFMEVFYDVPKTVYIVDGIDALDEENSNSFLKFIQSIFCGSKSLQGSRILLFSREQISGFINIATFIPGIRQISTLENVMGDIQRYIETSIVDKTMFRKLTNDRQLLEEIKSVLLTESSGMFLWVYLQLEILWSTCFTDAEIRLALSQLPKDLEETYHYCIKRIVSQDNNSKALKVLKWVSFATRPLHIEEIKEAVAFGLSDTAWDDEKVPQEDFIIGCCANLVILDPTDRCVRFAHSSVKIYLAKHRETFDSAYPINEEQGQLQCGEFCIAYLSFSNFNLSLAKKGQERTSSVVPNPTFLAGDALASPLRHFFRTPKKENRPTSLKFNIIRTPSIPDRNQFKFLDYAVKNWGPQTKCVTRFSPVWDKFEQLATNFNETWNFHPWDLFGRSIASHLHSLLGWAVKERHMPLLTVALKSEKYIQQVCNLPLADEGLPVLHIASKLGYHEMIESLLTICNVNSLDVEHYTPLHHAAGKGHIDIVQWLSNTRKAIVDFEAKSKITPLWVAASNGHAEVVSLLIAKNCNVEARDVLSGKTALSQAAENGHHAVVYILLRNNADIGSKDKNGWTVMQLAAEKRRTKVLELMARYNPSTQLSCKTLILGTMKSGKSTVMKQLKILYGCLDADDRVQYRPFIYQNLFRSADAVLRGMQYLKLKPSDKENQEYFELLKKYTHAGDLDNPPSPEVGDAMSSLWKDDCINTLMKHQTELNLYDSTPYFFNEAKRIASHGYLPTEADIIRVRVRTTTITATRLSVKGMDLNVFDVGGARGERKKWVHTFENVSLILFCAPLSDYDQSLPEGVVQNRMQESLMLFESLVKSEWFSRTLIVIFFTKYDLLKNKLADSPLENHFPDYTGGNNVDLATNYIIERFDEISKKNHHHHMSYTLDATNTASVNAIFVDVIFEVLTNVAIQHFSLAAPDIV